MKRSEEINLSDQIKRILAYSKKNSTPSSFYKNIDSLKLESVQDLSFEKDIEFFNELKFVLSVILSIIAKPHLSHRRDEIMARSGEVSTISEEDFQKTLRDSSIWKAQDNGLLLPEYLYYHQYEDEIKIYENIFIVYLVNEISLIADHYSSLYLSLLSIASMNADKLLLDDSTQLKAMDAVNLVSRRIDIIKSTYFYKEVSRAKNKPKVFRPTNILLKDRLYNICFKFYKKMYVYEENSLLNKALYEYYFVLLLKVLKQRQFVLESKSLVLIYDKDHINIPGTLYFKRNDLSIALVSDKIHNAFRLELQDEGDEYTSSHVLIIDQDPMFDDIKSTVIDEEVNSAEYLSLWHLAALEEGKIYVINQTLLSEQEMINMFLDSHHHIVEASERIYSSYCATCKMKNLVFQNGYYRCPDCGAIYKFSNKAQSQIIFAKISNYGRK